MSFGMNPFGAWADNAGGSSPSVFGALPYPSDPAYANMTSFFFTSLNPNILNCTVVGAQNRPQYTITTDGQMAGYTTIKNSSGQTVSLIEWQSRPMIEIRGVLPKQNIRSWLALNSDKRFVFVSVNVLQSQWLTTATFSLFFFTFCSSRTMTVRGMQYTWAPRDKAINVSRTVYSPHCAELGSYILTLVISCMLPARDSRPSLPVSPEAMGA